MAAFTVPDRVASLVHAQFDALPRAYKPRILDNGTKEWTALSGIVVDLGNGELRCVALGTGTKCLPHHHLPTARGLVLHDSHAEIHALRAFNRYLLEECRMLLLAPDEGRLSRPCRSSRATGQDVIVERRHDRSGRPFKIRDGVSIYLYCSKAPCGDASMEVLMRELDTSDPWERNGRGGQSSAVSMPLSTDMALKPVDEISGGREVQEAASSPRLEGRGFFSELGVVRRKPARADAALTICKSCSDKLALSQCSSLLRTPLSLLIDPSNAFLTALVVPETEHDSRGFQRAFSDEGRMKELKGKVWGHGYAFNPFKVITASVESEWMGGAKSGNVSVVWCADVPGRRRELEVLPGLGVQAGVGRGLNEVIVNGVRQGWKYKKVVDPAQNGGRGASGISRRKMWEACKEVFEMLKEDDGGERFGKCREVEEAFGERTYEKFKRASGLEERMKVKRDVENVLAPGGWVRNTGDEKWEFT